MYLKPVWPSRMDFLEQGTINQCSLSIKNCLDSVLFAYSDTYIN